MYVDVESLVVPDSKRDPASLDFLRTDVLANWEKYTVRQDGDAIRRLIGTIGVSSPLSSIRKAFTSIRDAEEESVRIHGYGRAI